MRAAWPALMARDRPLSTGPFCCSVYGAVSSRRIWRPLQYSTNAELVYSVPLFVLGPWNSYVGNEPLHHSEDGRCALVPCPVWALKAGSAVHKHDDVPRASQGFRKRSRGVDVDQVEWSLCPGCGVVRCRRADALGHRTPRAWCQLPYKLDTVLLGSGFQYTRMGMGKGNVEVVNIYYSLFYFC